MKSKHGVISESKCILKNVLISIGIALGLDLICYLLTGQGDLFNLIF